MATEAVVELVVDASRAERDVESQLRDIVRDAERGAPTIDLDADTSGSGRNVESQIRDIARDAERNAPTIGLVVEVIDRDVFPQIRDIVAEAERGAPGVGLDVRLDGSRVDNQVRGIVRQAELFAPRLRVDVEAIGPDVHDQVREIIREAELRASTIRVEVEAIGPSVAAQVRGIVRDAEQGAPTIHVEVEADGSGVPAQVAAIVAAVQAGAPTIDLDVDVDDAAAQAAVSSLTFGSAAAIAGKTLGIAIAAAALPFIGAVLGGAVISIAGIGIIGLGAALLKNDPEVKAAATKLKDTVLGVFQRAAEPLKKPFIDAMNSLGVTAERVAPQIDKAFKSVAESGAIQSLADGLSDLVTNLLPGLNEALENAGPVFEGFSELLGKIGTGLGGMFEQISKGSPEAGQALSDLGTVIEKLLITIGSIIGKLAIAYGHVRDFVEDVIGAFQKLYNVLVGNSIVPDLIDEVIRIFKGLPGRAASALVGFSSAIVGKARDALVQLGETVLSNIRAVAIIIGSLPNRALDALGDLGGLLFDSGVALVSGFADGIRSQIGDAAAAASAVLASARAYFPFSPAKKGPFSGKGYTTHSGKALVNDFAKGILSQRQALARSVGKLFSEPNLSPLLRPEFAGASGGAPAPFLSGPMSVGAPNVAVYIGNERLGGFVDSRIDGRNSVRDRQAAQGARF